MRIDLPGNNKFDLRLAAAAVVAGLVLSACSGGPPPTEVRITAPTPGTSINVGQGTVIQGEAVGDGIVRVEVVIDGLPYATLNTPDNQGVSNFPVQVPWTPTSAGSHAIQLKAFGSEDRLLAQSDPLVVEAKAAVVPTQPVPTATQPPPPPAQQQPTPAPATGGGQPAQPQPAPTQPPPQPEAPSLTVTNDFVNVREGPNTAYRLLGRLNQNETAPVRGKSADGRWWQITYAAGPGGIGWVFGEYVRANAAAAGVPVAAAPPLPTQPPAPPPVVVPTAIPPTAPPPVLPTVPPGSSSGPLSVNTTMVASGGTVRASWSVQNVDGVWFDKGDGAGFQGVPGQWSMDVTNITANRTLSLKVKQKDGQEPVYSILITVSGSGGGTPGLTGWNPKFKAGTTAWDSPDTCTELGSAGGSCTYYWTGLDGAQGIWIRVEPRDVACAPTSGVNVEPGDVATGWRPVIGPSGSLTIKFNSTGGHVIILRVKRDNNDWYWKDEKPLKVQPCGVSPTNTPAVTNTPAPINTPTATPVP